ncbi:uncharacterized protein [Amphiura filiformis]|uniref:uncharacterized protein n=1 Tax=Amphiura filiformis TaxID=82378 RepID=UPI003B220559
MMNALKSHLFGFVLAITVLAFAFHAVAGKRCYSCTAYKGSWPECQKMDNFTLDCGGEIVDPTCDSGEHRFVEIRYNTSYKSGGLSLPDCIDDGIRNTVFPESGDVCVSEEALIGKFREQVDKSRVFNSTTDEEIDQGEFQGTACFCQTSLCTAEGLVHTSTPKGVIETTTPKGNAAVGNSKHISYLVIAIATLVIVTSVNIW